MRFSQLLPFRAAALGLASLILLQPVAASASAEALTPAEARAIAKQAYVYGHPMVDNYRIHHAYFVDRDHPEYKADWNRIRNIPRVYTHEDRAVHSPNSDTPYSMIGMDLRTEPLVLTVPAMEAGRYFSIQFTDLYTHNFDYVGTRTTGNGGGRFLVAGPGWRGEVPAGIDKVIRSETELAFAAYRTQLLGASDLDNVKKLQDDYTVQTLSAFLGKPAPMAAPAIDFIAPLTPETQKTALEFLNVLNFVLRFCPVHPSEQALMTRFAKIGVGAGKAFDASALSPEIRAAIEQGRADAWADLAALRQRAVAGEVTSAELFGTREYLQNNYLYRMLGAVLGIYGASKEEAIYPIYAADADGRPLDGAQRYTLRFAPGELPPVRAFWSLTMYELPASQLVANPLNRYLLNSPMLDQFKRDADGGITFHIQHASPGAAREANWLPAPEGPFIIALRMYLPESEALAGQWKRPAMQRAD